MISNLQTPKSLQQLKTYLQKLSPSTKVETIEVLSTKDKPKVNKLIDTKLKNGTISLIFVAAA